MSELKEQIKKVMLEHLETKGYPNMEDMEIMRELKPMWIKIEEAGLVQPGMGFEAFRDQATHQFILSEMRNMV